MDGTRKSQGLSMGDVIGREENYTKKIEEAQKNAEKEALAAKKRVEKEIERRRKEQEKLAQEAKKAEEKKKKEEEDETASLRYQAYREIYPDAKHTPVRAGADAAKYNAAVKQMKLSNALNEGPESVHMVTGLVLGMYTKMCLPEHEGGMGINPFGHRVRIGTKTLAGFWMEQTTVDKMRQPFKELIAEHPSWFVGTPALLKCTIMIFATIEQFSRTAIEMEKITMNSSMPSVVPPVQLPKEPEKKQDSPEFDDL